jgi:small subunit ribosomal protein S17
MAEKKNEETPENIQEEVADAASAAPEEGADAGDAASAEEASAEETTADEAPKAKAAPKGGATRREKMDAKRAERQTAAGKRPSRTPEERDAERRERRAALAKQRRAYRQKQKAKKAESGTTASAEEHHAPAHGPGRPKVRQGVVVSEKGEKTITVKIDVVKRHKRYHKILRSTVKLYAHDERNDAHEGDTVRVMECRPMSRSKRWRLVEVLERAK